MLVYNDSSSPVYFRFGASVSVPTGGMASGVHVVTPYQAALYPCQQSGEMEDSPEKNHHSHVADAMQYAALHADGGALLGAVWNAQRREIKRVNTIGWT